LCGPRGVARVYGPQKGATPAQVDILAQALERLGLVVGAKMGRNISNTPGSGASGGLGAGLMMLGARLRPRSEAINEYFEFDRVFEQQWDFVITAEGSLDGQSTQGKMTTEVARRAKRKGAQVVALAGTIGEGADATYGAGIKAFTSILKGPLTLEEAIVQTETLIQDGAEKVLRMILVGLAVAIYGLVRRSMELASSLLCLHFLLIICRITLSGKYSYDDTIPASCKVYK
jgi:glycerate kinase